MKLYLIRHGATLENLKGVMHKVNDEAELSPLGISQIRKTAEYLIDKNIGYVFSSTEVRAVQSADIIAQTLKINSKAVDNLQERNWGRFTGKPWGEVSEVLDKLSVEERYVYKPSGGESWKEFVERLSLAVHNIVKKSGETSVAIVTHGGAIRALTPSLLNEPKETSFNYDPPNASISEFDYKNGKYTKKMLFSTDHL